MADDIETVNTAAPKQRSSPGMSPATAALLYGGAAATVGGPLGLIVGALAGITAKRQRDNYLDREAAYNLEQSNFNTEVSSELKIADEDEARLLQHAKRVADAGWYRLAAGDPTGREMIDGANSFIAQIINGDREARKQEQSAQTTFQRNLIGGAAEDYRKQYQAHITDFEAVDTQVGRLLDLTANPDFDPDKQLSKGVLIDLISSGVGGFYRDTPGMLDSISQGVSGLGALGKYGAVAGGAAEGIVSFFKSKDFKASREDYNRIAFNMRNIAQKATAARMERLSGQAADLNNFARKTGAIPEDYSLADYVTGGTKELKMLPVPKLPAQKVTAPKTASTPTFSLKRSVKDFVLGQRKVDLTRPVN
jgi:hypothetical protein